MSNAANIFSSHDGKPGLSEEKLRAYLEGKLSPEEQREVELWLAEDGMESDAMDGLQQLNVTETKHSVSKLNRELRKQLAGKKRKRKNFYKDNHWAMIAVFVVLLLCVLAFVVLRLFVS